MYSQLAASFSLVCGTFGLVPRALSALVLPALPSSVPSLWRQKLHVPFCLTRESWTLLHYANGTHFNSLCHGGLSSPSPVSIWKGIISCGGRNPHLSQDSLLCTASCQSSKHLKLGWFGDMEWEVGEGHACRVIIKSEKMIHRQMASLLILFGT